MDKMSNDDELPDSVRDHLLATFDIPVTEYTLHLQTEAVFDLLNVNGLIQTNDFNGMICEMMPGSSWTTWAPVTIFRHLLMAWKSTVQARWTSTVVENYLSKLDSMFLEGDNV